MYINRRDFIKTAGLTGIGFVFADFGFDIPKVKAATEDFKLTKAKEFTSVCHFCACGCGVIGHVRDGKLINLEGATDHIVNEGSLCSKGVGYAAIPNSDQRPQKPLYRAPGSDHWEEISWDEAIERSAKSLKKARDENWTEKETIDGKEYKVNRTDAIGFIGGSQVNNEECYLLVKMARALGIAFIDNQTRVCHSATPPALNAGFGRGAMTNSWTDLRNTQLVLIEGSNIAECHPMGMKGIMMAKERGAKIIHVDTRFTRTSKIADLHVQVRPGTDIAFLGSIINYIMENKFYNEEFMLTHTNAYHLINKDFKFDDGIFSGFDGKSHSYERKTWGYQVDAAGKPIKTTDLNHPDSVFSKLKEFYKRYTFEMASNISGAPVEKIKEVADMLVKYQPGVIMYALGMTQHTVGVQNIRCFTIVQLLMGNIGRSGAGVDAMRGQPNVQGSTDFGIMYQYFPGYLSYPTHKTATLEEWTKDNGTVGRKSLVNLLKAWLGENATKENNFGFDLLSKRNGYHNDSLYVSFEKAVEGIVKCMYITGQNPQVTNANLSIVDKGLANLDSLIVQDIFVTETASFWQRPGCDASKIQTEVIFLPAASYLEREGTLINSSRMIQWRYAGPNPPGDAKPDIEICNHLFKKVRELYKDSAQEKDQIIQKWTWNYPDKDTAETVLKEINGYDLKTGKLLNKIGEMKDDGSTSAGLWLYAGVFGNGINKSKRRGGTDPSKLGIFPEFAYTWPDNMRILYNRASCDKNGKPYDEKRKLVWWDESAKKWDGYDVPDVPNILDGPATPNGQKPFRMASEGVGRLFAAEHKDLDDTMQTRDHSYTPVDGPVPEFYEPIESPTENALHEKVKNNPCVIYPRVPELQKIGTKEEFPYVLCTSGIAEHWCSGAVTRNVPWLNELVKEPFVEIPVKLAAQLSIKSGIDVKVRSTRGEIKVKAMVTDRAKPLMINGVETFMVWMPYGWGFKGLSKGPSTNYITIDALDPNVQIQEFKACLVDVKKA